MPGRADRAVLSAAVRAERAALAADLSGLDDLAWATPSLCGRWTVEDVVAHLTAAAHMTPVRWLASIVGARFDADVHNARRLAEHRGATPAETLASFRAAVDRTTAPPATRPRGWARSSCTRRTCGGRWASRRLRRWRP